MAAIRRTSWLRRGYAVRQVDAAVAAAEAALEHAPPAITASEVRRLGFHLRHHGYEIADVDVLLDALERRSVEAELRTTSPRQVADRAVGALDALRDSVGTRDTARFPRAWHVRRGYDTAQVDALLARSLADLEGLRALAAGAPARAEVDPDEVRDTVFRRRRHGYREEVVDQTFDEIVDLLLRRDVLHAQLTTVPFPPAGQDVTPEPPPTEESSRSTG